MQMIEGLDRGLHAFMPTGMHWTYARIYKLYQDGKRADARVLFNKVLPILAFSNQHLDVSIHFFKTAAVSAKESSRHLAFASPSCLSMTSTRKMLQNLSNSRFPSSSKQKHLPKREKVVFDENQGHLRGF